MRYAFGLVGMLIAIGVLVLILSKQLTYEHQVIRQGNTARDEAAQIAGIGARESVVMGPVDKGGKLDAIKIKQLYIGGPIQMYYGLQVGDQVVEVGYQRVRDIGDPEMAEDLILEGYQRSQKIVVMRNGQRITLPPDSVSPVAIPPTPVAGATGSTPAPTAANGQPAAQPAANSDNTAPKSSSPDSLLKSLNIPTH